MRGLQDRKKKELILQQAQEPVQEPVIPEMIQETLTEEQMQEAIAELDKSLKEIEQRRKTPIRFG